MKPISSLVLLSLAALASAQCYDPNGVLNPEDYAPCPVPANITGANASMCCRSNTDAIPDTCREDGLCQNSDLIWRESCSDPTWKDPGCLKLCVGGRGRLALEDDTMTNMATTHVQLTQCADGSLCCGEPGTAMSNACCRNKEGIWIVNGEVVNTNPALVSSSSSVSSTSTSSTTSAPSSTILSTSEDEETETATTASTAPTPTLDPGRYYESKKNTPIGAIIGGVLGGGIALALLLSLFFILYRRRKNQNNPYKTPGHPAVSELGGSGGGGAYAPAATGNPSELGGQEETIHQLGTTTKYAHYGVVEMDSSETVVQRNGKDGTRGVVHEMAA